MANNARRTRKSADASARKSRSTRAADAGDASASASVDRAALHAHFVAPEDASAAFERSEKRLQSSAARERTFLKAQDEHADRQRAEGQPAAASMRAPRDEASMVTLSTLAEAAATRGNSTHVQSLDLEDLGLRVSIDKEQVRELLDYRQESVARVFSTLDFLGNDLSALIPKVPQSFPPVLTGHLVNPDGSDAAHVSVRALRPDFADEGLFAPRLPWPNPETTTDARGVFSLNLPSSPIPDSGLTLNVVGSNRTVSLELRRSALIGGIGKLGLLPLDKAVEPLPRSIIAQLGDVLLPTSEEDALAHPEEFAAPAHAVTLGEGDCARSFRSNSGVIDKFSYSMLVRLVAPSLSARRPSLKLPGRGGRHYMMSSSSAALQQYIETGQLIETLSGMGSWQLVEREPIEAPIDVSKFINMVETNPRAVPKAATLALGYTVRMHQVWLPTGLSLGDLVYSLPLAPGEQQRIAVSEERETLSVREMESMSAEEQQRYSEHADTSASSVFSSAFDESASGGSKMKVNTESGSFGGGLGVGGLFGPIVAGLGIGGGYSDSTTTGSTSSWQKASRDYVSSSSQAFHSNLSRQAAARRSAARASVRLASSSERREIVTKVITNHNHNHALTMQYWQVLRHFGVTSTVDDVQLVCFVPLELVQFLPTFMPRRLPTGNYTRDLLLLRYDALLRHHDVIAPRIARNPELRHGLRLLRELEGNPTMTVDGPGGAAQDTLNISIRGTFLPFEDVYATAYSTTGARVGPVRLVGAGAAVAEGFETRSDLLQHLRARRNSLFETRTGGLSLPSHIARSNLARIEFTRSFQSLSYKLSLPSGLSFNDILGYMGNIGRLDVSLGASELEREIGPPLVNDPSARINGAVEALEAYNGVGGTERMPTTLPVAALRLPPVLPFADLLRIEALLQHVVENTVTYSKAVWQSLTPEERAIMLERYTIGVPDGGVSDASDEVPLLNCVANQVLGYFGNAAIMPFFIPEPLARAVKFTSREIQEALLTFHRQAYQPARSSITLPARGVLGEAVLGSCNSSEKIDLTRFWNWQDSPAPQATDLVALAGAMGGGNQLVGPSGASAPSALESSPMITINQGPTAFTPPDLASKLIASQPASNLPTDLTGITQLGAQMKVQTETTAETLNKTIAEASGLAKAAMNALPHVVKAKKDDEDKKDEGKKEEKKKGGASGDGATDGGAAPTS